MSESHDSKRMKLVENLSGLSKKVKAAEKRCEKSEGALTKAKERDIELEHTVKSLKAQIMAVQKKRHLAEQRTSEAMKKFEEEIHKYDENEARSKILKEEKAKRKAEKKQLQKEIQLHISEVDSNKKNQILAARKEREMRDRLQRKQFRSQWLAEYKANKRETLKHLKEQLEMKKRIIEQRKCTIDDRGTSRLEAAEKRVEVLKEKLAECNAHIDSLVDQRLQHEMEFQKLWELTESAEDKDEEEGQLTWNGGLKKSVSFACESEPEDAST